MLDFTILIYTKHILYKFNCVYDIKGKKQRQNDAKQYLEPLLMKLLCRLKISTKQYYTYIKTFYFFIYQNYKNNGFLNIKQHNIKCQKSDSGNTCWVSK